MPKPFWQPRMPKGGIVATPDPFNIKFEFMKQLIISFIFSRLDYCIALLIGLPFSSPLYLLCNGSRTLPHAYFWDCRGVTTCSQPEGSTLDGVVYRIQY